MERNLVTRQRGSTAALRHHIARDRVWRLVDAKDQVLGRVACQIATILQGKHKPHYFDNMNCGDPIVVINAKHVALTGRKSTNKVYVSHSGYPGSQKHTPITHVLENRPTDVLRRAVKNMLPRNKLRDVWLDNLHLYPDEDHNHKSVKPSLLPIAHCSPRIGRGGPPTQEELDLWWMNNLTWVTDKTLEAVATEAYEETMEATASGVQKVGLSQILQLDSNEDNSANAINANTKYIQAAQEMLNADAVIVPSTL